MSLSSLLWAFWYILPAYFANASPVLVGGGRPIDGGRYWKDGRRVFGDGKTWRGLIGGVAIGTAVGALQYFITPEFYGSLEKALLLAFLLSFGALFGDLVGSFFKRRIDLPRGSPAIGLDQLGFLISALAFAYPVKTLDSGQIIFLLVVSPFVHWGANYFAYKMGWKSVPW
ncbi:CDP-2,3-bis-(O-geranylgeranyl)-sn-glycerol synthase [Thermococcus sp. LS1]|uniref:CDP-2,3-bis-(O-geranylgeranyl)-sn-glycerol synthase n=1 Tax=unclassified Thermococcus TaxID=2627626 RepID=UPI0014308CA0|nr:MULTISPECIES: CDP-2,3-bis-(O-geranylgeranyl)-sn-glycerol synthase [unclassified Thermococcus]NJD98662.1 CDP-2,3-bis-(O-geranylgeranyl)-sn-glycerol synthase [Thermococcus sp. LS1]NJE43107.1 CDP-2,3-bis-(O-geranylgeranyl)-sn-glycerol synthase [Thermococcus sp. GR6]